MSQPIALGAILGGRYKVSASLLSTADDDHVLQGEDQILRRRVSILVPAAAHEATVVENARALAAGAGHSGFQVLDMGQTDEATYLITSYAPAPDLLDALLFADENADDYSLSDDIFGNPRTASSASYIYQEPDPTQPQQSVAPREEGQPPTEPAVTRWEASDYDDYDSAPAAPSVRNKLGLARKVRPGAVRSTLFDRAASRGGSAGATVAAGAIDPTYDGDNRYDSYQRTEGKPDRLDERHGASRTSPSPDDDAARHSPGSGTVGAEHDAAGPGARTPAGSGSPNTAGGAEAAEQGEAGEPTSAMHVAAGGSDAAAAAGAVGADAGNGPRHHGDADPADRTDAAAPADSVTGADTSATNSTDADPASPADGPDGPAGAHPAAPDDESRKGPLRWLLLLLLAIVLIAAIVMGFRGLGALTGQFSQQGPAQQNAAPGDPQGTPGASAAPSASAAPAIDSVKRVTADPNFMADTDATLNQATDGNPATFWLSYGFSDARFGSLAEYVGLAAQLKEPATAQELTIQQANGSGGQFTVYVADEPSFEGAQEVGKGSFTGPETRVPLSDAARSTPHRYVLVKWTELPRLTSPIGGYSFGLRIGEIGLR
ncbi:hypothetical protein [Kocuria rhizophila]|uniref:hypothetical protein n=1 Tax=Kocuria rhizophila TaxID=72000 RepID=UPI0034DB0761